MSINYFICSQIFFIACCWIMQSNIVGFWSSCAWLVLEALHMCAISHIPLISLPVSPQFQGTNYTFMKKSSANCTTFHVTWTINFFMNEKPTSEPIINIIKCVVFVTSLLLSTESNDFVCGLLLRCTRLLHTSAGREANVLIDVFLIFSTQTNKESFKNWESVKNFYFFTAVFNTT